ncbi:MAG TPA: hypothetical protein VFA32_12270 [Dehalococcoidia bacterium]|jgi:hypothetical protein|nr:hypothetical protein [Dehalococcoidia bacterium]
MTYSLWLCGGFYGRFYGIANLQPHRYFDFRFSIKRLYLYVVWVLELETTRI